jgi:mRNA interferase MazF
MSRHALGTAAVSLSCPITTKVKEYPFEVALPDGLPVSGAILSDQVKKLDWRACKAEFICIVPESVTIEVLGKLETLVFI